MIRSEYNSEQTKYLHFQTLKFGVSTRPSKCNIGFGTRIKIWHHCLLSVPICGLDARNPLMPSKYAIQTSNISALTLKVLKGLALRGGYCHEPEYFHFITTILTSILDLSVISLQIIFSYPFCTA